MPLVSVSHVSPSVEERLQDGGVSACGLGCLVWVGFGVFVPFSTICLFFPSFNDDLGTMPTRRPYSWKKILNTELVTLKLLTWSVVRTHSLMQVVSCPASNGPKKNLI